MSLSLLLFSSFSLSHCDEAFEQSVRLLPKAQPLEVRRERPSHITFSSRVPKMLLSATDSTPYAPCAHHRKSAGRTTPDGTLFIPAPQGSPRDKQVSATLTQSLAASLLKQTDKPHGQSSRQL